MIVWYRNSFLASIVSIFGCFLGMLAAMLLVGGIFLGGIVLAAIAVGLIALGKQISVNKEFEEWWKQVKKNNLEAAIRRSRDAAVDVYNLNPEKRTLEKIRQLNPEAARYIENGCKEPAPKPQPAPAPKPALQSQQVSAAQPQRMQVPAAAVQSAAPQKENVGEQLDQIMAEVTANLRGKDDLNIYWDCAKRADSLYERNREHGATKEHLSALYFLITTRALALHKDSFVEIRRLFAAVQRGLNLDDKRDPIKLDIYAYMLKRYAVEGALIASREKDRNEMQTAYHWMDIAAAYTIVGADDTLKQAVLYNDALNTCRAWLCFWMANSYFQQVPKNQNLAELYIEESLRYCPAIPSRNCDLNPKDPDQTVVMRREQVEQMRAIICG